MSKYASEKINNHARKKVGKSVSKQAYEESKQASKKSNMKVSKQKH